MQCAYLHIYACTSYVCMYKYVLQQLTLLISIMENE